MAIVPLLVMRINVMMAISSKGTSTPAIVRPNTLLGSGHGTVVEILTVM
jgi:hypothetical protein